jgi:periplasmic protein CpxP/Spy
MKNSNNRILTIAVLLLLVANIVLVFMLIKGKGPKDSGRQGKGEPFEMMAKELKMTEQQRKDYKSLREEHQKVVKPLFDSLRTAKTAFYDLMKLDTVSDSLVNQYSQQIAVRQIAIDKVTFTHFKKVRTLFNPDQLPQYDSFMKKMMQRGRRDSAAKKDK